MKYFNKIIRKVKKILGIKSKQIWLNSDCKLFLSKNCNIVDSKIILEGKSVLHIADNVMIKNVNIHIVDSELRIDKNSELLNLNCWFLNSSLITIENNVSIKNYYMDISHSKLAIEEHNFLYKGNRSAILPHILMSNSALIIRSHNVIKSDFWIRFGGICEIGEYNCINEGTELRCDESIKIGDFNMISYECNIWDTNTHCIYFKERRREITKNDFPNIGVERERPITKPIIIGNDTWIGKRAIILKGTIIEDETIVGVAALVSNKIVQKGQKAVGNPAQIFQEISPND